MLEEVLRNAKQFHDACRKRASVAWFRGHGCAEWHLKSTLHRQVEAWTEKIATPISANERRGLLRDEAQKIYREFINAAWPLLNPADRSEWGQMFVMQHYGLPTRMLDWSESFACALFFAQQQRTPSHTAAIWALDSQGLNEIALGVPHTATTDDGTGRATLQLEKWHPRYLPPDQDLPTIAVAPRFTNPRMTAQQSAFTFMGDDFSCLTRQFDGRLVRDGLLVKIELAPDSYDEVESYLQLAGISPFTFFPDLHGLALRHKARVADELRSAQRIWPHLMKGEKSQ